LKKVIKINNKYVKIYVYLYMFRVIGAIIKNY
jgi:hypothetical protein